MLKKKILIAMIAAIMATSSVQVMANENKVDNYSKANEEIFKKGVVKSNSGLNVRTSPKVEDGNKIFAIEKNTEVAITEEIDGWYKILVNNKEGWVSSQYIEVKTTFLYVTASSLNLREEANTNSRIVDVLVKEMEVEFISMEKEWVKVKHNDKIGFVHKDYVVEKLHSTEQDGNIGPSENVYNTLDEVVNLALGQIGKPYVYGAEGPDSFDCSGLVRYVYNNVGVKLPRTAEQQSTVGVTIKREDLKKGDLIFSSTDGTGNVSHVGIYIGDGYMVHSPKPGDKVNKTSINSDYWKNTYLWSKRVI